MSYSLLEEVRLIRLSQTLNHLHKPFQTKSHYLPDKAECGRVYNPKLP